MKKERFKKHSVAMIVASEQRIKTLSAFIFHQYIVIVPCLSVIYIMYSLLHNKHIMSVVTLLGMDGWVE